MTAEGYWNKNKTKLQLNERSYNAFEMGVKFCENQIADLKANCDLAIEGRDVKIMELTEQIEHLIKEVNDLENMKATLESKIAELEQQIEEMKCCQNCKHCAKIPDYDLDNEEDNNIEFCEVRCHEKSGWELKE